MLELMQKAVGTKHTKNFYKRPRFDCFKSKILDRSAFKKLCLISSILVIHRGTNENTGHDKSGLSIKIANKVNAVLVY